MKYIVVILLASWYFGCYSQTLQLKGRIRCSNDVNNLSTRGAENIIVVPSAIPKQAVATSSEPSGYYIIDTKIKKEALYDKSIKIYVVTRCKTCRAESISKFVSPDQITYENGIPQLILKTKYINNLCKNVEFTSIVLDTLMLDVYAQENRDIEKDGWVASPALLNLLMFVSALSPPEPDSTVNDVIPIDKLSAAEIRYGNFLLNSSFANSASAGFNFAPGRDFSEAAFWNPASIAQSDKRIYFSSTTNWRNQLKLSAFWKANDKIAFGLGFLDAYQREPRTVYSSEIAPGDEPGKMFRLNENALFLSASYHFVKSLSIGITGKYMKQNFDNPQFIQRTRDYINGALSNTTYAVIEEKYKYSAVDADISLSWAVNKSFNWGINLMNVMNTNLMGGNFLSGEDHIHIRQFAVGSGLLYRYHRLNLGTDVLFYNDKIYNISFGANFIPFDKSLIAASYSTKDNVWSLSFRYNRFRIGYVNNQGLFKLKSKNTPVTIEKPYLYSSFVFDF